MNLSNSLELAQTANDTCKESGMSLMSPPQQENPSNLAGLKARGAKVILYHGVSDGIFSAEDTRQWLERVNRVQGGDGASFARYFPVPGMNHCSGGPATDQFDLLSPLVDWVERGVAPDSVKASVRCQGNLGGTDPELAKEWSANRSRDLCSYPKVATFTGSGSMEDASNYRCQ